MEFDKLFNMRDDFEPGAFRVEVERPFDAFDVVRGAEEPPETLRFRRAMGKRVFDMIGTGNAALELLSPRALQVLRDGSFTGWRSFAVEITGKKGKRIEGYEGLVVTGRCGPIDWSKGKLIRKPPPVPQGQGYDAWVGMYFDPGSWDGSDLFLPEGTTYKILTERVKTALEEANITNMRFEPLTEFERSWPE